MKNNKKLNAGKGMTLGIVISAAVALVVQLLTGDGSIWSWAIPVGLATGLAVSAGNSAAANEDAS